MNWRTQLNAHPLPLLLEESEPGVRYLVLRGLLDRPVTPSWKVPKRRPPAREDCCRAGSSKRGGLLGEARDGHWRVLKNK